MWSLIKSTIIPWFWELHWGSLSLITTSSLGSETLKEMRSTWGSISPALTLKVEDYSISLQISLDAGIHQGLSHSDLEEARSSSPGRRYCSLLQRTHLPSQDICCQRKNADVHGATIEYRGEVGGCTISDNRNLSHLYSFMGVEKNGHQEQIQGLVVDEAAGSLALDAGAQLGEAHRLRFCIHKLILPKESSAFIHFTLFFISILILIHFSLVYFKFSLSFNFNLDFNFIQFNLLFTKHLCIYWTKMYTYNER